MSSHHIIISQNKSQQRNQIFAIITDTIQKSLKVSQKFTTAIKSPYFLQHQSQKRQQ